VCMRNVLIVVQCMMENMCVWVYTSLNIAGVDKVGYPEEVS